MAEEGSQPTGEETTACAQCEWERYYFLLKLSLELALKEREMTNEAPTYRPRHSEELRDGLKPAKAKVTEES